MNVDKINILITLVGVVLSVLFSTASSAFFIGEKVNQIFSNTNRIIILETDANKVNDLLTELRVSTEVNKSDIKHLEGK